MKLFRESNIQDIIGALDLDEYDDSHQDKAVGNDYDIPEVDQKHIRNFFYPRDWKLI